MSWLPALLVAAISAAFGYQVLSQYLQSHKSSHFFWFVSLSFSALAALFYCLTLWTTPHSPVSFELYYLLGVVWMPALMGLGSLGLVLRRTALTVVAALVCVSGLIGSVLLFGATIDTSALTALDGGAGVGILRTGLWLVPLIVLNTFGAVAVFGVALASAWKTFRKQAPVRFFYGNLWLAGGILVISVAGSLARLGWPQLFWITMSCGWIITYVGYRLLTPVVQARTVYAS